MEADDVELDVEGIDDNDRPSTSSLGLGIDPNELPSVSSHLSPELSQHPWLTFDDHFNPNIPHVILHDDMDESSRATIHQMITEEHSYLQTKKFMRHKNKGMKTLFSVRKNVKKCTKWTKAERELFKKGLEEYGHNWKEISDLVKTRDPNQVKNFARKYLLNQAVKADGQDFSSNCSVKVPESLDTHQLPDDDDDDEEDIDVEETSDDEQKDQGLQSTVLFGEVLKSSVPLDHRNNLDSHQAGTSILLIPKFEPSESQPPEVDEIKLKTGTYRDEYIAYVAGPDGPILIKTEKPSSEDEDALTICLPGQSANPAGRSSRRKEKGWKVPRKW
nr:histone H2A deubiquitinase MYSM1-like [Lytechinus pictus]